jgi:hypothetical protein
VRRLEEVSEKDVCRRFYSDYTANTSPTSLFKGLDASE